MIVNQLYETHSLYQTEIAELKNEKKNLMAELDKFTYNESMIGKELVELKVDISKILLSSHETVTEIESLPSLFQQLSDLKQSVAHSVAADFAQLFASLDKINDLHSKQFSLGLELKKLKNSISDAENEKLSLEDCFLKNQSFLNDEKAYSEEYEFLKSQKKDLEEELKEFNQTSIVYSLHSKAKTESLVLELTEEQAAVQLAKIKKKNASLEETINYQHKSSGHHISESIHKKEQTLLLLKQYSSLINEQSLRIEVLKQQYHDLNQEIHRTQNQFFESYALDDRFSMLSKIIQNSKFAANKDQSTNLRRLIKKESFISSIENTVFKAREVTQSNLA